MLKLIGTAAAGALALAAAPAFAQAVTVTNVAFTPGSVTGTIHSASYNGDAGIGRFEFKGTVQGGGSFDYFTYCVDLAHYVSLGAVNYSDYSIQPLSALSTITAAKASSLNALLTNTSPLLAAATGQNAIDISAATQMAVWEIMFETQPSWSVTNSSSAFYLSTPAGMSGSNLTALTNADTLANSYLSNVSSGSWTANAGYQLKLLYSPTHQTQVFLTTSVPEPATWGMMILGFGAAGAMLRRRGAGRPATA